MSDEDAGPPPLFDVGDRVVAADGVGGMFRPRVRRGERGIVVAREAAGELRVRFANGRTRTVHAAQLAPG